MTRAELNQHEQDALDDGFNEAIKQEFSVYMTNLIVAEKRAAKQHADEVDRKAFRQVLANDAADKFRTGLQLARNALLEAKNIIQE